MAVPRGNFIIQLLVEIDRSAEPEWFDQEVRLDLDAPRPEPVGKALVEGSSPGRDAFYPQREPPRLRPALQETQWKPLELELQAIAAPPQQQGVRGYAQNNEVKHLAAPPRRAAVRGYALNESRSVVPRTAHIVIRPVLKSQTKRAEAREGWGSLAAVFIAGAIIGLAGYAFLQPGDKGGNAEALSSGQLPKSAVAGSSQAVVAKSSINTHATNSALQKGVSDQAHRDDGAGNRAARQTMAQPADDALLKPASNKAHRGEVPKEQSADESPAQMPDDALLAQAANLLQSGDLRGARTAYKAVADRGNVRGAVGLAETYDPDVLAMRRIQGAKPDPSLARKWYERAAKRGSLQASERVKELRELQDRSSASDVLRR